MNEKITAEQFLREKLESEVAAFGNGTTEFHTVDLEYLLKCLEAKDTEIAEYKTKITELNSSIDYNLEHKLKEVLTYCMTVSNWTAEERLNYVRQKYKADYLLLTNK